MNLEEAKEIFEKAIEANKNHNIDKAIELFSQIGKTSNDMKEIYASAQFSLGLLFEDQHQFVDAEKAYKNVLREEQPKLYAITQLNLGLLFENQNRLADAETAYKNVLREDQTESYAVAQFNLGLLFKEQNRLVDAEEAYKNVLQEDHVELYAKSQLNLGVLLKRQKRFEEAEKAYKNVLQEDRAESYAKAQLNLGLLFEDQNRLVDAEEAYKNVLQEDRAESYAKAQLNLGVLLKRQKRFEEAEQAYKNVLQKDRIESYAKAQLNLGLLFEDQNRLTDAEKAYKNVLRKDQIETYAKAQVNLGFLYNRQDKSELCIKHFRKVIRSDSSFSYAYAQYGLWLKTKNKIYLKHIDKKDDYAVFQKAQFQLGELEYSSSKPKLNDILSYWGSISENSKWYPKIYYKKHLIERILSIQKIMSAKLLEIFKKVDLLLSSLVIKNVNEDLIAHYTSPFVAKLLVAKDACGFSKNSKMRLNTIDLMNDPTEGEILNHYLNLSSDLISTNDQAFMGCFTLHHDSLNQFRLYGKENQKEGSGLSLILSNQFFEQENSFSNIRLQNTNNSVSEGGDLSDIEANSVVEEFNEKIILRLPLYRCIYIDPDSKLIEISHREEWTFCREEKKSKSDKWESYSKRIENLRDQVRREFRNLENLIQPLYQKISENIKKYSNEAELLAEILLPLRFLIKHMAFKEEQECRVVYVTQWDDHYVQYDENLKRFYIDYGPDVVTHLKKIYLGPHAVHEKNMFEYLCSHAKQKKRTEHEVKIKISHNPLR